MRRLIRFEDAYGMADLVCMTQDLGLITLISNNDSLLGVNEINESLKQDTFIECGVSFPSVLIPTNELIANIKEYKIEEIIIVYDMDAPNGAGILKHDILETYLKTLRDGLDKQGLKHAKIKLAPVVWAAETLAICILKHDYTYIDGTKAIEATEVVHAKNTAKLHGRIIKEILNENNASSSIKTKHLRHYINKNEIEEALLDTLEQFPKSINKRVIKWIISGDIRDLFDIQSAIKHQINIENYYQRYKPTGNIEIIVNNQAISLNKKCW